MIIRGKKGEGHFPSHSYLIVDESEVDGRLKIEIMGNEQQGGALRDGVVRYFDLTTDAKAGPFAKASIEGQQIVTKVGQVRLRNQAFLDEETGKGIVMDVLNQDPEYRRGKSNVEAKRVNVCHTYIQRLIANPDVQKGKLSPCLHVLFPILLFYCETVEKSVWLNVNGFESDALLTLSAL